MKTVSRITFSSLVLLFVLTATLKAQKTAIVITGGLMHTAYEFDGPQVYSNTSFIFPWSGRHARVNGLLGAEVIRAVSTHWQLKTGLRLYLTGYTQEIDLMWPSEFTPEGYKPLIPNERLVVNHLFLEIPLLVRYRFTEKRFAPYAEAGISTNYYLTTGVKQRIEGNTEKFQQRNEAVNPVNVALRCAAGVQYRVFGKQLVFLQPVLRYQMGSIEKTSANPSLGWGVEAGWMLQLKG